MSTLSAAELAIAMRMRDRGDSWRKIGAYLHRETTTVRDALVAEGYVRDSRHRTEDTPENRQRAYQLYIVQGLTMKITAGKVRVGREKLRCWIIAEGGEMRRQHNTRVHGIRKAWGAGVACAIGGIRIGGRVGAPIGAYYCAEECMRTDCRRTPPCGLFDATANMCISNGACDFRKDPCQDEVTPENRAGFEAFEARRAEHERLRKADPKPPRETGKAYEYEIKREESDEAEDGGD